MVQDKKIASMKDHRNRGIGRRFKNHKSEAPHSASSSAMFPAYERIVLREGEIFSTLLRLFITS